MIIDAIIEEATKDKDAEIGWITLGDDHPRLSSICEELGLDMLELME